MIFLFILNLIASAESVEHKAHVHGSAKVGIAFEGAMGKLTFEAPGHGLFGFEHVAKKSKDLQKQKEMLKVLQNKIGDMFVFSKNINCTFGKEKININQEDGHSDVDASFDINCEKAVAGYPPNPINVLVQGKFSICVNSVNCDAALLKITPPPA